MSSRSRRWRPAAASLTAVAMLLTACAEIPTAGPVRPGGDLRIDPPNEGVPFIAEPPRPGAAAEDIVVGFLRAGADFRNDHAVARDYLTPTARQAWEPDAGTVVYTNVTVPEAADRAEVVVRVPEVAQIDREGTYRRTSGAVVQRSFQMERVAGQWRIARLDDGLLLSLVDVSETYRQVALYFLAPSGTTLVPDLVLLPQLPGLSTQLVSRLLRGPTGGLGGAVRTAFPPGTSLEVASVPVRDGLATVRLDSTALDADSDAREQMSAQIVWTLKQLGPEIARVRITAGGEDLVASGVEPEQPRESWESFDPDALPVAPSAYVVRDGAVGRVIEVEVKPVAGPAGRPGAALRTPAISLDASRIAVVSGDGTTLLIGRLAAGSADEALTPVATGQDVSRPSWDPSGNLWFVDRPSGQLQVLFADQVRADQAQPVAVTLPPLPGGPLRGLAVSRDGARVAMVAGAGRQARLTIGSLTGLDRAPAQPTDRPVRVVGVHEVLPDLRAVRDVAWADATTVVVLGSRADLAVRPYFVTVDGYQVLDVEPVEGLVSIAAAPPRTNPLVAATDDGELMRLTPGGWTPLGPGNGPAYPG